MKTISEEVLAVLSQCTIAGEGRHLLLPQGERLDRRLYVEVNKALEAIGGKWTRKHQAHVFSEEVGPLLESLMLLGHYSTSRDIGFFETPEALAHELVAMAGAKDGMRALEPSAGTGRIARALARVGCRITVVERDPKMRHVLAESMLVAVMGARTAGPIDFMDITPDDTGPVAVVVMNPPFTRVDKGDHLDHVRHAFSFLRAEGTLVSVLPASVTFRKDSRHSAFRAWACEEHGGEITPLPAGSFKESGTMVNTCVLRMRRR